jgi:hypothetical protein
MKYVAMAVIGIIVLTLLVPTSFTFPHSVFAGSYEKKSQAMSQTNECGNYWFPVNVICSNLNSQVQGNENNVVIATTSPAPDKNYEPPFP